jgi:hypothetical protein
MVDRLFGKSERQRSELNCLGEKTVHLVLTDGRFTSVTPAGRYCHPCLSSLFNDLDDIYANKNCSLVVR